MANESGNDIPVAANVLGTIGTILWCIQLVPQIWYNWRRKTTEGLPASMMLLWATCAVPLGIYLVLQNVNIPLQIQPQAFGALSYVTWGQILYYDRGYSRLKAFVVVTAASAVSGGLEALFILTLRIPYRKGTTWPALFFGIIAAIMLVLGLIPPYFEIRKRRGRVIGINWVFLAIDTLGALFSLFSLAAQNTFDILGGVNYILVALLEFGIYGCHIVWRIRNRKLLREAKRSGRSVDELLEEHELERQREKSIGKSDAAIDYDEGKDLSSAEACRTADLFQSQPAGIPGSSTGHGPRRKEV